ncbi:hypothetical protein [Pleionea sediminis]|uniref:hypothetical protein n=1 Tax=Pleionea sediminis TaxID=2569479 RepID=UPI0011853BF0|nr:hypothetical protein [Pleionea sediminis]
MFESIKHWFESLNGAESHFDHPDDEMLHGALASALMHIILSDKLESDKEKSMFFEIMQSEFKLDNNKINFLYKAAKSSTVTLHEDFEIINKFLKDNPVVKAQFLDELNRLIDCDGVQNKELDLFYEAVKEVFPEISRFD